MKKATANRDWFLDSQEEVVVQLRTEASLERVLDQRAKEARARVAEDKKRLRKRATAAVRLSKMYPISYWAEMLGVSAETVRIWCKSGEVNSQWLRKDWRITEQSMTEFLEKENQRRARKG